MSKTKKSKLLASMLCATVVAGLYAGPVMAAGDVEYGTVTAEKSIVGGKDVVKLNGSKVNVNADVINGGFLKVTNDNGKMVFAVDSKGAVKAANGKFGIADDGTVSVGGDETNGKIILDAATGTIKAADGLVVGTENGEGTFKVKNIGGNTMAYMVDADGKYTVGINAQNGNIETKGALAVTNAAGNNVFTASSDGIKVGYADGNEGGLFAVDAENGNTNIAGELKVNNGLVVGTEGDGTFKVKNIGGNTMAYMVDADGKYTVGINAQNGNIETKGALAVTNAAGENVFTANSNGIKVGYADGNEGGLFSVNAATGDTKIAGGLDVGTDIKVAGSITASSLTLDGVNVGDAITDLQEEVGSVGGDLTDLTGRVGTLETNTAGITNDKGVTVIDQGLKVKGEDGREVFSVARDGAINAEVTNGLGGTNANFVLNGENVELKYGTNGITANIDGTTISGNGTVVVVNENGATFTNANGTTVINGGAITADTLKLANLDEDVATEINNLKDSMDTVGGDVSDLRNDVAQNTNDIGLLRTDVGVLRTDVNTLRVDVDSLNKRLEVVEDKTQNINGDNTYGPGEQPSGGGEVHEDGNTDFTGNINSDSVTTGEITADKGTIGGVTMEDGKVTAGSATIGDVQVSGSLNVADKVTADKDGVTVAGKDGNKVVIDGNDVSVTDKDGNTESIMGNAAAIDNIEQGMASMSNRISKVEDRIDKVGAMSAAIANLRTMGYDPTAPTEIAVGLGQYRSETGAALGLFHYPNKDFMLSLSVSTSGDEVMGGIGATWKFGRKSPEQMLAAEKEKAAKAKLAKAEAMKKAAAEAKVAEQQAKHAKMAAEKAAK